MGKGSLRLAAVAGDITLEDVDVVVNAANSALAGGGGVDGAIHRAAGAADLHFACRSLGGCKTGDAKLTPGFALRARYIAHTVGPVWRGGDSGEPVLLASCYRRCVELAEEVGASSIAFPAISTGIFGYPREAAARVAIDTLRGLDSSLEVARLIAFDDATYQIYEQLLAGATP